MRGGYIHNRVLLDPIAHQARRLGAEVSREVAIRVGGRVLYGDLLLRGGSRQILVEAEMSSRRIPNDLAKARALEPCDLWVVVPNPRVGGSVRRKLSRGNFKSPPRLFVFSLPHALQRLEQLFELISGSNVDSEKKEQSRQGAGDSADPIRCLELSSFGRRVWS